jgi:hypothetical protein
LGHLVSYKENGGLCIQYPVFPTYTRIGQKALPGTNTLVMNVGRLWSYDVSWSLLQHCSQEELFRDKCCDLFLPTAKGKGKSFIIVTTGGSAGQEVFIIFYGNCLNI